jgi:farnesyl diphosphate synthase
MGRVPVEGRRPLRGYARDVGLAFQITDDLLDVEGEEEKTGKRVGKDKAAGKETFVSLLGVERARQQAEMLVAQGIEHLHGFGAEADLLRAIARFAIEAGPLGGANAHRASIQARSTRSRWATWISSGGAPSSSTGW